MAWASLITVTTPKLKLSRVLLMACNQLIGRNASGLATPLETKPRTRQLRRRFNSSAAGWDRCAVWCDR